MNGRSPRQSALPGLAPMCPHCGDRRSTVLVAEDETVAALLSAERWECRACGGVFWSLPTLATRPARQVGAT